MVVTGNVVGCVGEGAVAGRLYHHRVGSLHHQGRQGARTAQQRTSRFSEPSSAVTNQCDTSSPAFSRMGRHSSYGSAAISSVTSMMRPCAITQQSCSVSLSARSTTEVSDAVMARGTPASPSPRWRCACGTRTSLLLCLATSARVKKRGMARAHCVRRNGRQPKFTALPTGDERARVAAARYPMQYPCPRSPGLDAQAVACETRARQRAAGVTVTSAARDCAAENRLRSDFCRHVAMISPTAGLARVSVMQPYGEGPSECGYCHAKEEGRLAYGAVAKRLTCLDYQAMIDVGWRRSGTYCYQPVNAVTCCPNLTIRLPVAEFSASKAQLKLVRKFNRFLAGEIDLMGGDGARDGAAAAASSESSTPAATPVAPAAAAAASSVHPIAAVLQRYVRDAVAAAVPTLLPAETAFSVTPAIIAALAARRTKPAAVPAAAAAAAAGGADSGPAPTWCCAVGPVIAGAIAKQGSGSSSGGASAAGAVSAGAVAAAVAAALTNVFAAEEAAAGAVGASSSTDAATSAVGRVRVTAASTGYVNFALLDGGLWVAAGADATAARRVCKPVPADSTATASSSHSASSSDGAACAWVEDAGSAAAAAASSSGAATPREPAAKRQRVSAPATPAAAKAGADSAATGGGTTAAASADAAIASKKHAFRVDMVPSAFDEAGYQLYKKYQMAVHGDKEDECTKAQYTRCVSWRDQSRCASSAQHSIILTCAL